MKAKGALVPLPVSPDLNELPLKLKWFSCKCCQLWRQLFTIRTTGRVLSIHQAIQAPCDPTQDALKGIMVPSFVILNDCDKPPASTHTLGFPERAGEVNPNQVRGPELRVDTGTVPVDTQWDCV